MSNISQKSFLSKLLDNFRKSRPKSIGLAPISAFALMTAKSATSESDSAASNIPESIKGVPNAATLNLLSLNFNQPQTNPEQWSAFSSDIDQSYITRYDQIQDNLNSVFGGYTNYNYLAFNQEGPNEVNTAVGQRLLELEWKSWDQGKDAIYTTAEMTETKSCLSGTTLGSRPNSDYVVHSICLTNQASPFVASSEGDAWSTDLRYTQFLTHEYFHHVQRTHTLERGLDHQYDHSAGDGPTSVRAPYWWTEGAAVLVENWYLRDNWRTFDHLKKYDLEPYNSYLVNEIVVRNQNFYAVAERVQNTEGPYETNLSGYGQYDDGSGIKWDGRAYNLYDWELNENHISYYSMGDTTDINSEDAIDIITSHLMATTGPLHFMAHKSSWQAVLRDIPADYYELGFWGAVEKHTGLNEQAFYDEFNALMRSVDLDTVATDYAPEGWKIPDGNISDVVDFLNISPFASGSFTINGEFVTRLGSKISDADVVMSDGTKTTTYKTAEDGSVSGDLRESLTSSIKGDLSYSSSTKVISSQDALDALKLSVGLSTSAGTKTAFDFMSADFNQDGKVSSQDALSILKYSVGLTTPEQAKWVFVDTNGDYSGVSKSNTSYTEGVSIADLSANTSVSLTGILIGDVNDSYSGLIA